MELSGKIKKILELQTFNSGFQKRELILQTDEQYPQTIAIEFVQDRVSLLDVIKEGDDVRISINIRGREWTNPEGEVKYFNSIVGWRVEKMTPVTAGTSAPAQSAAPQQEAAPSGPPPQLEEQEDDLPF